MTLSVIHHPIYWNPKITFPMDKNYFWGFSPEPSMFWSSEEDAERGGGPGSFDNRTNSARDSRSEKIKKSQTERGSQTQVARRAPQTSVVETQTIDVGRKQRSDEKKLRWLSNKLVATSGLASRLEERVDFHEKLQRANLRKPQTAGTGLMWWETSLASPTKRRCCIC